jgi:hypothetical protein
MTSNSCIKLNRVGVSFARTTPANPDGDAVEVHTAKREASEVRAYVERQVAEAVVHLEQTALM